MHGDLKNLCIILARKPKDLLDGRFLKRRRSGEKNIRVDITRIYLESGVYLRSKWGNM